MRTPDGLYVAWWKDSLGEDRCILHYNEQDAIDWLRKQGGGTYLKFTAHPLRFTVTPRMYGDD